MDWSELFFRNWQGMLRTVIVGTFAYITLETFLRISGKRTFAKLIQNAENRSHIFGNIV